MLVNDMNNDVNFYMWFLIVFFLWVLGKTWTHNQQAKGQRKIENSLRHIEQRLGYSQESDIGSINKKIRENLKRIREKG